MGRLRKDILPGGKLQEEKMIMVPESLVAETVASAERLLMERYEGSNLSVKSARHRLRESVSRLKEIKTQ